MNKENEKIILGLDVSTTTIGVAIYKLNNETKEGDILLLTHITPKVDKKIKGIESLFLKKRIFEEEFLNKYIDFGITDVVIEEPLLGSNNVNTVAILLRFNGMISDSIYGKLNLIPTYLSSYDARKYAFPELLAFRKFNKKGEKYPLQKVLKIIEKYKKDNKGLVLFGDYLWDIDKKDILLQKITEKFPSIDWIYNTKDKLIKENYDTSDALVTCLAFVNKEMNGELNIELLNFINEENKIEYILQYWGDTYKRKITL